MGTYEKVERAAEDKELEYVEHVLRGSSGLSHLQILEGMAKGEMFVSCSTKYR